MPLSTHHMAGTATDESKDLVEKWLAYVSKGFAADVVKRIKPVRYDIVLGEQGQKGVQRSGTLICEVTIEEDMLNGYGALHGGCAAFLVDVCTSVTLSAFSPGHVSVAMNVEYHQPIPRGTTIEIFSTTRALGKRILSTRCEFIHKEKRTLLLSGTHIKMPPSGTPVYEPAAKDVAKAQAKL